MCLRGEEFVGGSENILRLDGQQAGFGIGMAGVVAAALGAAENFESGAEGTVSAGVGGSIDAHNGADEGAGEV
jgi:hypothetical protein